MNKPPNNLPTITLTALEAAVLRFYADPSFDESHSAPAHPGLITKLVKYRLLRPEMWSYNTTPAGEAALVTYDNANA